jgi:general secretion pathway protein F
MQYEIRAIKGTEEIVRLALDAADEAAAREQARAQGFTVLSAKPKGLAGGLSFSWSRRFPLLLFSQELLALLSAGLSLSEVFDTLLAGVTRRRRLAPHLTRKAIRRSGQPPRRARRSSLQIRPHRSSHLAHP